MKPRLPLEGEFRHYCTHPNHTCDKIHSHSKDERKFIINSATTDSYAAVYFVNTAILFFPVTKGDNVSECINEFKNRGTIS